GEPASANLPDTAANRRASYFGLDLSVFANIGLSEPFEIRLGAFGSPLMLSGRGAAFMFGGEASMNYWFPRTPFVIGLGGAAGKIWLPEGPTFVDSYEPRSSVFARFYGYFGARMGRLDVGIRLGPTFTSQARLEDNRFGVSFFSVGIYVSYSLLPTAY